MARPLKFFLGITLGILALLAIALAVTSRQPPLAPMPNPNGYEDFRKAARLVSDRTTDWATLAPVDLRALVATNAPALELARVGLSRECRVPLDFSPTNTTWLNDLGTLKRLAQAFVAEGRLAELDQRTNNAVVSYLNAIRLGHETVRGGLIIHALVGVALEALGTSRLEVLAHTLDAKDCRALAAELERLESQREPSASIWRRERQWARHTYGLKGQIAALFTYRSLRASYQRVEVKLQNQQVRTERLLVDLAARAYELEKGARPKALAELVPAYLKAIPQDPVTGTNLNYWP